MSKQRCKWCGRSEKVVSQAGPELMVGGGLALKWIKEVTKIKHNIWNVQLVVQQACWEFATGDVEWWDPLNCAVILHSLLHDFWATLQTAISDEAALQDFYSSGRDWNALSPPLLPRPFWGQASAPDRPPAIDHIVFLLAHWILQACKAFSVGAGDREVGGECLSTTRFCKWTKVPTYWPQLSLGISSGGSKCGRLVSQWPPNPCPGPLWRFSNREISLRCEKRIFITSQC